MMTLQLNASLPAAEALTSAGSGHRGPDAARHPADRNIRMGTVLRQNTYARGKYPIIQPLSMASRDWRTLVNGVIAEGSPDLAKDDTLASEFAPEKDICGRHFLFDKKCMRLERNPTVIPPLPRDYRVLRRGNLHPFSKELSHSHTGRPPSLGYSERCDLNTSPAILFPPTLVLNGRNTILVENCKLNRPKVNYPTYNPTYNLLTVRDNHKSQTYPDPMAGASRSYIHRISELSSLEGDTVRQEKLKKMKKARKPPS